MASFFFFFFKNLPIIGKIQNAIAILDAAFKLYLHLKKHKQLTVIDPRILEIASVIFGK